MNLKLSFAGLNEDNLSAFLIELIPSRDKDTVYPDLCVDPRRRGFTITGSALRLRT